VLWFVRVLGLVAYFENVSYFNFEEAWERYSVLRQIYDWWGSGKIDEGVRYRGRQILSRVVMLKCVS
jgi:hypothetical protein